MHVLVSKLWCFCVHLNCSSSLINFQSGSVSLLKFAIKFSKCFLCCSWSPKRLHIVCVNLLVCGTSSTKKHYPPSFNSDVICICKQKDKAFRKYCSDRTKLNYNYYRFLRGDANNEIRQTYMVDAETHI